MKNCSVVINAANGKESVLYNKLLSIFKDEKKAKLMYSKIDGSDFKEVFGDWEAKYKAEKVNDNKLEELSDEQAANSIKILGEVDENGEPKLFERKGVFFFKLLDKTIFPLTHLKPLREYFSLSEINDATKFLLFNYVGEKGNKSMNFRDAETDSGKIMDSINRAIERYKKQVLKVKNEKIREKYLANIQRVEEHKEHFRQELIYELNSVGEKVKTKVFTETGENTDEVAPEDRGGGLSIKDSTTVNSKETATVNTKIMLSQIRSKEYILDDDGDVRLVNKLSGFLGTSQFENFDDIWATLAPLMADKVPYGTKTVTSTFAQMKEAIRALESSGMYPWAHDLLKKLDSYENQGANGRWKAYEFVQAFNKTKINYVVTEWDPKNKVYKVINATSTNSRESQVLERWGSKFQGDMLGKREKLTNEQLLEMHTLLDNVRKIERKFNEDVKNANKENSENKLNEAYNSVVKSLFKELRRIGAYDLKDSDFNLFVLQTGGQERKFNSTLKLIGAIKRTVGSGIMRIDDKGNAAPMIVNGDFNNPFRDQKYLKLLAKGVGMRDVDSAESSVLVAEGKNAYVYSNPSYISNKINEWKKDKSGLERLAKMPICKNSKFIRHLLALDIKNNKKKREEVSQERLEALSYSLASSFKSKGRSNAVDNVKISLADQINDNITKILGQKIGGKSYFPAIIAADKSRRVELQGFDMMNSGIKIDRSGNLIIPPATIEMFVKYFADEYSRMKKVSKEIRGENKLSEDKLIKHYHTGNTNGLKSQLFPQFSHDSKEDAELIKNIKIALYDKDGHPLEDNDSVGLSESQASLIREGVKISLTGRLNETITALENIDNINPKLLGAYSREFGVKSKMTSLAGDYLINGLMSSIEYTKLFSGDPAYYKDLPDLIKRIPSSFSDGLQLMLETEDDLRFNIAVVNGVEVASQYVQMIEDSLDPKDKDVANAYKDGEVNVTDAQAWITPNRWRFLKRRLGQWDDLHDSMFRKMTTGQRLSSNEMKVAAQPLKGVYFEINNGVPTYLKYSQAVLIPSMIKDGPMKKLLDKMTIDPETGIPWAKQGLQHREIHEVITEDGIKVGAMGLSKINEGDTARMADSFELNPYTLSNAGWKLQQDLPVKTMHETNVGSQIQKNIFEGMDLSAEYNVEGENIKGSELRQRIHNAVSALIKIGKEELMTKLDIKNGKISDKSALYEAMIDEVVSRNGNENVIEALQRQYPFDNIPQIRGRVDAILMSMFNKAMTKISTEGGSFIQVSPFGFEDIAKHQKTGIKIVSDRYNHKGLLPPRKDKKTGQTLPGQVLIPHTLAVKLLGDLDFSKINNDGWKKLFRDPKVRELVGYRIPNQGMSSNDSLEIVGVLPETMGDSIIGYDGIPAKTGSDFDIDKMYVMAPNIRYNKKEDKIEFINKENTPDPGKKEAKQIAQNELVSLYSAVLQSPNTYANMMRSIDSTYMKEDINELFPPPNQNNLDIFSPITQLKTKASYMDGKMGVALTANQLVDHVDNQSLLISIDMEIGFGVKTDVVTRMDRKNNNGKSIADVLSSFLNAYVDIAKDPYITRGNHNEMTANIAFMMIRAGVDYKMVNRFIGQPIVRDYVLSKKKLDSITARGLKLKNGSYTKSLETYMLDKYNVDISTVDKSNMDPTDNFTNKMLEDNIKGKFTGDKEKLDLEVIKAFVLLETKSKDFSDAVIAAKVDTKGSGGSPVQALINRNKIDEVKEKGFVLGYDSKFENTALGTYKEEALDFTRSVLAESSIMLAANADAFFNEVNVNIKGPENKRLISDKMGKAMDSAMYTYLMSGTKIMKSIAGNHNKYLVELPRKINLMKETFTDNFLIQELELGYRGGYNFMGVNSKNKPASYQNKIYRSWLELYNGPKSNDYTKEVAVELVKYSFIQSGFQSNLNQFFTHIPNEILRKEGLNLDMMNFFDKLKAMKHDNLFFDQFMRHNWDNRMLVPKMSNEEFIKKYELNSSPNIFYPPFLVVGGIFKKHSKNGIYKQTFKLGYTAGKNKIFEYNKDVEVGKSIIDANNRDSSDKYIGTAPEIDPVVISEKDKLEKEAANADYATYEDSIGNESIPPDLQAQIEAQKDWEFKANEVYDINSSTDSSITVADVVKKTGELINKGEVDEKGDCNGNSSN